jgi:Glycosyltransferase family 87
LLETAGGAHGRGSIDCGGVLSTDSKTRTFILVVFFGILAAFALTRPQASLRGTDFPDFYCAARMLAGGHGHQLYDADVQRQYQARYSGRVGTLYIHPPFEAVLYLAVAWLPLRYAYVLWLLLSLACLATGTRRLVEELPLPRDWLLWFAGSLTFVPVLLCLMQGQDSLLLLLLVVLAFTALRRGNAFATGCWLGLGLFKFQLALPLMLVLVLTQNSKVRSGLVKGFGTVALALAGLSAAISGWSVVTVYPKFLMHLQAQPFAGVIPTAMANFRGLVYLFFRGDHSAGAVAGLTIISAASLITILMEWKNEREFDLAFANTVVFALLVSYHLNPHDLSLLLLPVAILLHWGLSRTPRLPGTVGWTILGLLGILLLPPLHLWALKAGGYALISLPLLVLFLGSAFLARREKSRSIT